MQIAFVAPDAWTVWLFYRHLLETLQRHGAAITVFTASDPYVERVKGLGARHVAVPYARFVDPRRDLALARRLYTAFRRSKPDIVQNVTIKANLYGALAARAAGTGRIINTVEGAGSLYTEPLGLRRRAIRAAVEFGLRHVRRDVSRYWFVNTLDRDTFVRRRLATLDQSVVTVATGVDTKMFSPAAVSAAAREAFRGELSLTSDALLVTLVAGRLLRAKGVLEFLELARNLRAVGSPARALLVGPVDSGNPDAVPRSIIEAAVSGGTLQWIPFREDIPTVYAASDVVVVPTRYAEGTPKGVMEALAMERAVVCFDTQAVREMVTDGSDALLVPVGDTGQLTEAIAALLAVPERRASLGRAGRQTALSRFDADASAQRAMDLVYGSMWVES
jgi:glycosyltransferase involved in cell wall biosynthesis